MADTIPFRWPPSAGSRTKWVRLADNTELHIGQHVPDTIPINKVFHLGFTVKESNHYITGKYKEPTIDRMPSGAETPMIRDPDGNGIHLIEAQ